MPRQQVVPQHQGQEGLKDLLLRHEGAANRHHRQGKDALFYRPRTIKTKKAKQENKKTREQETKKTQKVTVITGGLVVGMS